MRAFIKLTFGSQLTSAGRKRGRPKREDRTHEHEATSVEVPCAVSSPVAFLLDWATSRGRVHGVAFGEGQHPYAAGEEGIPAILRCPKSSIYGWGHYSIRKRKPGWRCRGTRR